MSSNKTNKSPQASEETLFNEEKDYEMHSGARPSAPVYDFLYQDVRRVGSFLAQFEEYGVRSAVKATESVGQNQTVKGAASGTIGVVTVIGGTASIDTTTSDETKDIAEHTFDPLWANARRLLDYLETGEHINTDLWKASIGSFVEVKGSIAIVDLQYIQAILRNPTLKKGFVDNFYKVKNVKRDTPQARQFQESLELVSGLPHGIQLTIYGDNTEDGVVAWSTITNESLSSTAADSMLKHGIIIRGKWRVIGVLDAVPDMTIPTDEDPEPQTLDEIATEAIQKEFIKIAANLAAATRELIGRPRSTFGVTPILIFREVDKNGPEW